MEAILNALEEEKKEAQKLLKKYEEEFSRLPQGTFFTRKIGKQVYGYLTSSEGGEIQQEYLGNLSAEELKKYKDSTQRRRKLKALIKQVQRQLSFLEKALRHAGKKS